MTKSEFLSALECKLRGLAEEDKSKSIEYYNEIISDRIEDGMSEEDAVSNLGSVDEIANVILSDISLPKLIKQKVSRRKLAVWEKALLVLGAPIWLSLLIAAALVVFAVFISLWAVAVSLFSVFIGFACFGVLCIIQSVVLIISGKFAEALFLIGVALTLFGLAILMYFVSILSIKAVVFIMKKTLIFIKYCFVSKEKNNENS